MKIFFVSQKYYHSLPATCPHTTCDRIITSTSTCKLLKPQLWTNFSCSGCFLLLLLFCFLKIKQQNKDFLIFHINCFINIYYFIIYIYYFKIFNYCFVTDNNKIIEPQNSFLSSMNPPEVTARKFSVLRIAIQQFNFKNTKQIFFNEFCKLNFESFFQYFQSTLYSYSNLITTHW